VANADMLMAQAVLCTPLIAAICAEPPDAESPAQACMQMLHTQYSQPYSEVDGLATLLRYPVQNAGGCKVCACFAAHLAGNASVMSTEAFSSSVNAG
jgi:hypothetical protein